MGAYALPVIVHCDDPRLREALGDAYARLLPHEGFEANLHLTDVSMRDVVDAFWPAQQGWRVVSVEPGFHWMLFIVEHPNAGVAVCMLGGARPGTVSSEETWVQMAAGARARAVHVSVHVQSANRLALLGVLNRAADDDRLEMAEETLLDFLFASPGFMDDTVSAMTALGTFTGLQERAALRREAMLMAQADVWPRWASDSTPDSPNSPDSPGSPDSPAAEASAVDPGPAGEAKRYSLSSK